MPLVVLVGGKFMLEVDSADRTAVKQLKTRMHYLARPRLDVLGLLLFIVIILGYVFFYGSVPPMPERGERDRRAPVAAVPVESK
jgi:hypothetical protein